MSEVLFLGTGAADWELSNKGSFFRRNSAVLINSELMVDCGPHIFDFAQEIGDKELYSAVEDIIITHPHSDHFSKSSVLKLAEKKKLRLGCDSRVREILGEHPNIEYIIFKPFEPQKVREYTIVPIIANHDIVADGTAFSFHYILKTADNKTIFYGLDGAWFLRPSWEEMKKHKYDLMVFDCTVGDRDDWRLFEHNTIPMLRKMVAEIKTKELVAKDGMLVASHLARTLHVSHEKTEKILSEAGIITAYDGMKLLI